MISSTCRTAADAVGDILAHRIIPTAIEFMEQDSVLAVERLTGTEVPFSDAAAHLLIQLDGGSRPIVDADLEVVGDGLFGDGACLGRVELGAGLLGLAVGRRVMIGCHCVVHERTPSGTNERFTTCASCSRSAS